MMRQDREQQRRQEQFEIIFAKHSQRAISSLSACLSATVISLLIAGFKLKSERVTIPWNHDVEEDDAVKA